MEYTALEQDRQQITLPDGTRPYRIRTVVTSPGELPQYQIFVFTIADPADVALDTFTRVGTPRDLQTLAVSRAAAIAAGDTYYLDAEFSVNFDKLTDAVLAKDAIYSKVDTLSSDWYLYKTSFYAVDSMSSHPSVSPAFVQQLEDDFTSARSARQLAEVELTAAEAAVTAAQSAASDAQSLVDLMEEAVNYCTQFTSNWTTYQPAVNNFFHTYVIGATGLRTNVDPILSGGMIVAYDAWCTSAGDTSRWPTAPSTGSDLAARGAMRDALIAMYGPGGYLLGTFDPAVLPRQNVETYESNLSSLVTSYCGWANSEYAASVNKLNQKNAALAASVETKIEAEATLASAQTAESEALAAVSSVCSDFDPNSV